MKIGVLALQGDFREHIKILNKLNVQTVEVRLPHDLSGVDGLIIPGGESTSMGILLERTGLFKTIKSKHRKGMPIFGTCAGAILLAKEIIGNNQPNLRLIDVSIKRNEYGRQKDSFEVDLSINEIGELKGIFIRAPVIKRFNKNCQILAEHQYNPVLIRNGKVLISTFHPELTGDPKVHKYFLSMINGENEIQKNKMY